MKLSISLSVLTLVCIFGTTLCLNCKKFCRKIYDPYCLTYEDGTKATFPNECVLDIEICLNGLNKNGEPLVGTKGSCDDEGYSYYFDHHNESDNEDDLDNKT